MTKNNHSLTDKLRLTLSEISVHSPNFKGKTRLLRLIDGWLRRDNYSPIYTTRNSVNYQLNTRDLIDFRLLYFGVMEAGVVGYIKRQVSEKHTVVWDVGANTGSVSLPLLALCPNLIVHAFEPSPPVFERLSTNVALNPLISERINLHNQALSDSCGSVDFFPSAEDYNSGVGSLGKMHNTETNAVKVVCSKGDELIGSKQLQKPSIIKVDVEGFEYEVLQGLASFLENSKDIQVIFEHEPYRMDERGMNRDTVTKLISQLGFDLYLIPEDVAITDLIEFHEDMLNSHCDLVAIKNTH